MKSAVLFLILVLFNGLSFGQVLSDSLGDIRGSVIDGNTREPIPGVNVTIEGTGTGAASNEEGIFVIENVLPGTYSLSISFIGYRNERLRNIIVLDNEVTEVEVVLFEDTITLETVVVTPGQFSIMGSTPLSRQTLSSQDIKNMSWAEDVTRAVARLPGISSSDFSSKFAIRGGESDEVLITLDGMELYEPFHQRDYSGGLFSIVDIETIDGIELNTGGFSAEYGNRLSGVFNMRTKRIQQEQSHTSMGLSILNARFYRDGSFNGGKGSYLFSARRGMLDVLFKAIPTAEEATIDQSSSPKFYDLMAKVDYELNTDHIISFHVLHAGDKTEVEDISEDGNFDKNSTRYGYTYGWLTLNSTYKPSLSSQSILYTGFINHNRTGSFFKYEPSDKGNFQLSDKRDYLLYGIKQDWSLNISENILLTTGFEAKHLRSKYTYFSHLEEIRANSSEVLFDYNNTRNINVNPTGNQVGLYLNSRIKILPSVIAETGLRYDYTSYTKDSYLSPRIGIAFALDSNTYIRGAWGYYYQSQFINNLDINNGNLSFDPAQLARHYVIGFEHLFSNGINLRLEAYYKDLSKYSPLWQNLRDHLEIFPEARNDNARIVLNGATSKGIELFLKYDNGKKISWWVSYAFAKAVDDIRMIDFDGLLIKRTGEVPRLNDQRHTVYVDVNYRPSSKWHYNLSFQFYRGWPRTDYTYRYQTLANGDLHFYPVHGLFNGAIYPAYHRLDLRINRHFNAGRSTFTAYLHAINLYNRQNLKKFDLDTRNDEGNFSLDDQGNYVPFHDDKYWFGLIPVVGISWEF